ncbi:hypothetical protein [Caudoviricetes sp.]|nr:hypothetical protein [Caudoviricetes sp.]
MARTVIGLVDLIVNRVVDMGLDLSPKDVAFIISLFFEGMVDIENPNPVDNWLIMMADELNKVKDGG